MVSILVLTVMGATFLSPVYAPVATITLNISPNPALSGQTITFSGQVTPPLTSGDTIIIDIINGPSSCASPTVLKILTTTANSAGSYSTSTTLSQGTYSAFDQDGTYSGPATPFSPCENLTVSSTPIAEYPFGLAVLAILMIIGYGVIRRRTRNDYT